jgi:serine phosphatase RsbU (regulator of sigma subunit)
VSSVIEPAAGSVRVSDVPILLVEDDLGDALLVRAALADAGVADSAVTWVRTLVDALAALPTQPGCILLDLGLPDALGYGGVAQLVGAAPYTPVIVLTGRQERDGLDALAAGAEDYLVKDAITGELLERAIRYAMERKRAQATQEQLRDISVSAAEQARLERGLLPTPLLRTDAVSCSTYYRPGRDDAVLGGDFYDVVETSDGRIRAVVGDVMGHGADEAALGVHLRVAWRTLLLAGVPDDTILPTLARLLQAEADQISRYVTVCDITVDAGEMTVRLAGHPAPIISSGAETRYLDLRVGLPLGVPLRVEGDPWPANHLSVAPGTSVLLYTDGLLDAFFGQSAESIGVPELVAAVELCARAGAPPAAWVPTLLAGAPRDSIDDTAAVVLTVMPTR